MKYRNAIILVFVIIIIDQWLKIYIKTHFANGDELNVAGGWFNIHFIENEGMAYGLKIMNSEFGKILLTTFRLCAVIFGFFLLKNLVKRQYGKLIIICGSLILAGALGNLIDSLFYGLLFTDSIEKNCGFTNVYNSLDTIINHNNNATAIAHFTKIGSGYGKFMQGKVVDMLYFPLHTFHNLPSWFPFKDERNDFTFFNAIFNVADAAISVGVMLLIFRLYVLNFFSQLKLKKNSKIENNDVV